MLTANNLHPPTRDMAIESDGESSINLGGSKKHTTKMKSGMMALPSENIKSQEIWPHYNLGFGYVTSAIQFNQISFEQYIVEESKMIQKSSDPIEIKGRLSLMARLAYLKQKGHAWSLLRNLYAAIVNSIEQHDSTWSSDWRHIEEVVLDIMVRPAGGTSGSKI